MTPKLISSQQNPTIKHIKALVSDYRYRKKNKQSVLEGTHLLQAYQQAGYRPTQVVVGEQFSTYPEIVALLDCIAPNELFVVPSELYKTLGTLGAAPPIMATIATPTPTLGDINSDCLVIDGVQDSGNLGTLLRTAAATGFNHVICTQGSAQAWSPKTLRAAMGAHFSLTIYERVEQAAVLAHLKVPLFATSSHSDTPIFTCDLTRPLALVVGHEGQGVSPLLLAQAQGLCLPQLGQESLNVGVAGSICLYETLRQRRYMMT